MSTFAPVTSADMQTLVVLEVGDTTTGAIAANFALLWRLYLDKAQVFPRLQYLYVKRDAICIALAAQRGDVDYSVGGDVSMRAHQGIDTLNTMLTDTMAEITLVETKARAMRGGAVGAITQTTITTPPLTPEPVPATTVPDSNDPRFAGSPYIPISRTP